MEKVLQDKNVLSEKIPGPRGFNLLKWNLELRKNSLEAFEQLHKIYGETFLISWPRKMMVVTNPNDIKRVLKDNHQNYHKGHAYEETTPVFGKGLVTAEGKRWREQRRVISPEFNHKRIQYYSTLIENLAQQYVDRLSVGQVDLSDFFNKFTFDVVLQSFFGMDLGEESHVVKHCIHRTSQITIGRVYSLTMSHKWLPFLPKNREYNRCVKELDRVVYKLMDKYKKNPSLGTDSLLHRLLKAVEFEDQSHFTPKIMRDEIMTLMLAGHETTANTLMWTMYLLMKNPKYLQQIKDELTPLAGESIKFHQIEQFPLLKNTLLEAMRLYPVVPLITRCAQQEDFLGGYKVEAGTNVMLIQWLIQRSEKFFKDPLSFNPHRFEGARDFPEYAFFPFAQGPRKCIGHEFSMIESMIILSKLIPRFKFNLSPGFKPQKIVGITLFSGNGMQTQLS